MKDRTATITRKTRETDINLYINIDGTGQSNIVTGIGFFDHMLTALTRHACFDLNLQCTGDLDVDGHHTSEDCALAIGTAIDKALGERRGIQRFGYAYCPLDEALVRVVVDLSGRPHHSVSLGFRREKIGTMATENITHVFQSLAIALRASIHVDCLRGENDHHRSEAAFKACALALRQAVSMTKDSRIPSTKGVL